MASGGKEMEIAIKIAGKVESSFKNALSQATKGLGTVVKGEGNVAKLVGSATGAAAKGVWNVTKIVAPAVAAATAAVGAMGAAAVNTGREFEGAMSQVAATMLIDKTTAEGKQAFETLENAARECGASTAFSATEAAEALNYLALAGYDADKAATALPTVLKLAGAGAMDLAAASDMVTDSMSALGIEATEKNLTEFADKLAQTASKSNTSVAQLGEAILTVGGTAQGLAGGTTELNTALGILADNGIKAAEGGTHLRNMILSLQNARNSDAAAIFEKMGLSAYDTEGKMRSLGDIFGELNTSLAGASAQDVNSTLATIFNQTDLASARAMLAATVNSVESLGAVLDASLADSGTSISALGINLKSMVANFDTATTQEQFAAQMLEQFGMNSQQAATLFTGLQSIVEGTGNRFDELSEAVNNSAGACEAMYAIQLDNLNGDIDILKSGLSDLGISIYKDLNAPLREMTQLGTNMIGELSKAYKSGGMEGMVHAVGGCFSDVVNEIAGYAPKIVTMGVDLLEEFLSGITANSKMLTDAAADIITIFVDGLFTLVPQVILAGTDILLQFTGSMTDQLPQLIDTGSNAIVNFVEGIIQRLPEIILTAFTLIETLVNSMEQDAPMLIDTAVQLIKCLVSGIISTLPQLIKIGTKTISSFVSGITRQLPEIISMALTLVQTLVHSIGQNAPMLINAAIQLIGSLILGIISTLPQLVQMGIQLILNLVQGIISNLPQILQMGVQIIVSFISGITQMLPMIIQGGIQLIISLIQGIITNLGSIVQAAVQIIMALATGLIQAIPQLIMAVPQLLAALIEALFSIDWSQVGADILNGIADGFMSGFTKLVDSVKGMWSRFTGWLFGDDDVAEVSGELAASNYANGLSENQTASTNAVNSMVTASFQAADYSAAVTTGAAAGEAFSTSMIDGLDTKTFSASMAVTGKEGAVAWNEGFINGLSGVSVNTNNILDIATFNTEITEAGMTAGEAFSVGMMDGFDVTTFNTNMGVVGKAGAVAWSEGLTTGFSGVSVDTSNILDITAFHTEITTAETAGEAAGKAFSVSMMDSITDEVDMTVFSANMKDIGKTGAAAWNEGFAAGFSEIWVDASNILDITAFYTKITAAGSTGAKYLMDGFYTGLTEIPLDIDVTDTSGFITALTLTGNNGVDAICAGMLGNSQAAIEATAVMGNNINAAFNDGWNVAEENTKTAMQHIITTVTNAAHSAANVIKSAFETLNITIPKPKIPVISVSTDSISYKDGKSVSIPKFSVNWNAMGGIFNQPTIFNTPAGIQGVGEAGPEAVLPLDTLWAKMKEILNETVAVSGGVSLIDAFIEKLKGIGGNGQPELVGTDGLVIQYSPVYNLYGSAGKDEIIEADRMSQAEFNKKMKQYERDKRRRNL